MVILRLPMTLSSHDRVRHTERGVLYALLGFSTILQTKSPEVRLIDYHSFSIGRIACRIKKSNQQTKKQARSPPAFLLSINRIALNYKIAYFSFVSVNIS